MALCVLAACSGGGEQSASPTFTNDFERATASYEDRTAALKEQARDALGQGSGQIVTVYESMLAAVTTAHREFGALRPPKAMADDVETLVGNLDEQKRVLGDVIGMARDGDAQQLGPSLQQLASLLVEFGQVFQEIDRQLE